MQINTNIAKVVEEADQKARYGAEVKKVLSDPQILAWILKYTVREFNGFEIPDIMACMEGKPEVAEQGTRLYRLLTTMLSDKLTPKEKIKTMKTEYNIVTTVELEGGLATMCNLSDYIEEKGIEKGIEKGLVALVGSLNTLLRMRRNYIRL